MGKEESSFPHSAPSLTQPSRRVMDKDSDNIRLQKRIKPSKGYRGLCGILTVKFCHSLLASFFWHNEKNFISFSPLAFNYTCNIILVVVAWDFSMCPWSWQPTLNWYSYQFPNEGRDFRELPFLFPLSSGCRVLGTIPVSCPGHSLVVNSPGYWSLFVPWEALPLLSTAARVHLESSHSAKVFPLSFLEEEICCCRILRTFVQKCLDFITTSAGYCSWIQSSRWLPTPTSVP